MPIFRSLKMSLSNVYIPLRLIEYCCIMLLAIIDSCFVHAIPQIYRRTEVLEEHT